MIFSSVFDDQVTLFWDRELDGIVDDSFLVSAEGLESQTVTKTHVTFRNLTPDTNYLFTVKRFTRDGENLWSETVNLKTDPTPIISDVTKAPYFAVGDGKTLNTKVLQQAIDDCPNGGRLYFPEGTFLTGALFLHSNMQIFVDKNAVIQGTSDPKDYEPKILSRFEGTERMCYAGLINIGRLDHNADATTENVVIRGEGKIVGGGRALAEAIIVKDTAHIPPEYFREDGSLIYNNQTVLHLSNRTRGRLIHITNAADVTIADVGIEMGPAWTVHFIYSTRVLTYNCVFHSDNVFNGDGWDPDSSTDSAIFGCSFFTGDDSVAIKSGKNPEGNVVNRKTSGIRVFDCFCASGHGVCIGSEMSGGVENVKIWDCDLSHSVYGIELKGTAKRGGFIRNVTVMNTVMPRFMMHSPGYNDDGVGAEHAPIFENCVVSDCVLTGTAHSVYRLHADEQEYSGGPFNVDPLEIIGFTEEGHEVKNVKISGLTLKRREDGSVGQFKIERVQNLTIDNLTVQ